MRLIQKIFSSILILLLSVSGNAFAQSNKLAAATQGGSLAPMLAKVMPSVVNILAEGHNTIPEAPRGAPRDERGPQAQQPKPPRKFVSAGSGVVINAKHGFIVTNAHVVKKADRIIVTLNNGHRYKAKLIGADQASDVAVLQIKTKDLHAITFSNSDQLKVGDFVAAIGNPFGLEQSVTSGIISATQRSGLGIEGYEDFVQTDAPINPGNSGGALVNMKGELVGINTAILAPDGGNIGIGFAIPANMAHDVMTQLIKYGTVRRGLLGVRVQTIHPELAQAISEPGITGAIITTVSPGSPAAKKGLRPGDIIKDINGTNIRTASQVKNIIGLRRVGSRIDLKLRRNHKPFAVHAFTADPKVYAQSLVKSNPFLFGLALRDFEQQSTNSGLVKGVQVAGASENSPAWQAGLRPGDVIVSAEQHSVKNIAALTDIAHKSKEKLLVNILRGSGALFLVIKP